MPEKNYVFDTNVLIHDPRSIFRFQDNDIYIPIYVLEELDGLKNDPGQRGFSAREAIRLIDDLRMAGNLDEGIRIHKDGEFLPQGMDVSKSGKLFVYAPNKRADLVTGLRDLTDNAILQSALDIKEMFVGSIGPNGKDYRKRTILVTMDINLRVRAEGMGLQVAQYEFQSVDITTLGNEVGKVDIPIEDLNEIYKSGVFYIADVPGIDGKDFDLNASVIVGAASASNKTALCRVKNVDGEKAFKLVNIPKHILGLKPRNAEQQFALDLLLDEEVKLVTIMGKAGCGKAQPLDATIMTPSGPIRMGDVKPGQRVSTPDGGEANVINVFPQGNKKIYKITFSDGTSTECCAEHLWHTQTVLDRDYNRPGSVKTTTEIMQTLLYGSQKKKNHSIPITQPVEFETKKQPIAPYSFGALLGDGTFRHSLSFSSADQQIIDRVNSDLKSVNLKLSHSSNYDYNIVCSGKKELRSNNSLVQFLIENNMNNSYSYDKFIPNEYLYSSIENRLELLRGLMDTDGSVDSETGKVFEFSSTSKRLTDDIRTLVSSLGGICKVSSRNTSYTYNGKKKIGRKSFRARIRLPNNINPFYLDRKASLVRDRKRYFPTRYIVNVELIGEKEAQCILIDSHDHLYLTNDCIVTHNTLLTLAAGLYQVIESPLYSKLLVSRPVVPMGKDIGYLPGTMEEKMDPWMQPFYDNLDYIMMSAGNKKQYGSVDNMFDEGTIQIEPLMSIRGRSIPNQFIIIDEAQNLTPHEIKTIITRCGENTKIVLTGDVYQIDNPYITSTSNGLSVAAKKLRNNHMVGHLALQKGERSALATLAADEL